VTSKRPLRPTKTTSNVASNNMTTSSPSVSNQSSRPVSHLSGEDGFPMGSSVSMQQISERIADSFNLMQEEEDFCSSESGSQIMRPPPPKPPKPTKIKGGFFLGSGTPSPSVLSERSSTSALNNTSSHSSENLKNSGSSIYEQQEKQQGQQTKSTVSLNGLQRLTGQLKTSSDSVLNRVIWVLEGVLVG